MSWRWRRNMNLQQTSTMRSLRRRAVGARFVNGPKGLRRCWLLIISTTNRDAPIPPMSAAETACAAWRATHATE